MIHFTTYLWLPRPHAPQAFSGRSRIAIAVYATCHKDDARLQKNPETVELLQELGFPGYGDPTAAELATVDEPAPAGEFATWRATRQSSGFDVKSFEVRALPSRPIDGLRPGMTVLFDWPQ